MSEGDLRGARRLAASIDLSILQGLVALAPYNGARVDLILALSSQSHCQLRQSRPRKDKGLFSLSPLQIVAAFRLPRSTDMFGGTSLEAADFVSLRMASRLLVKGVRVTRIKIGSPVCWRRPRCALSASAISSFAVSFACRAMSTYRLCLRCRRG